METIESSKNLENEFPTEVSQGDQEVVDPRNAFQRLEGLDWPEITVRFKTDTDVLVEGRKEKKLLSYVELGFKNERNNKPIEI
jgi:hypothetical protein